MFFYYIYIHTEDLTFTIWLFVDCRISKRNSQSIKIKKVIHEFLEKIKHERNGIRDPKSHPIATSVWVFTVSAYSSGRGFWWREIVGCPNSNQYVFGCAHQSRKTQREFSFFVFWLFQLWSISESGKQTKVAKKHIEQLFRYKLHLYQLRGSKIAQFATSQSFGHLAPR